MLKVDETAVEAPALRRVVVGGHARVPLAHDVGLVQRLELLGDWSQRGQQQQWQGLQHRVCARKAPAAKAHSPQTGLRMHTAALGSGGGLYEGLQVLKSPPRHVRRGCLLVVTGVAVPAHVAPAQIVDKDVKNDTRGCAGGRLHRAGQGKGGSEGASAVPHFGFLTGKNRHRRCIFVSTTDQRENNPHRWPPRCVGVEALRSGTLAAPMATHVLEMCLGVFSVVGGWREGRGALGVLGTLCGDGLGTASPGLAPPRSPSPSPLRTNREQESRPVAHPRSMPA